MMVIGLMLLAIGVMLCVAGGLIYFGLRGRTVDDHPLCRHCGFDLTGKPDTTTVCGECGVDLLAPRAVRVGHRTRRNGLFVPGVALLGLLLIGATAGGVASYRGVNWASHKPIWWLLHDAADADAKVRKTAFTELGRRMKSGVPADVDRIAGRALAVQADAARPWDPAWADLLDRALIDGRLPPERERQYGEQLLPKTTVKIRPRLRNGEPLAVDYAFGSTPRVGAYTKTFDHAEFRQRFVRIDKADIDARFRHGFDRIIMEDRFSTLQFFGLGVPNQQKVGAHTYDSQFTLTMMAFKQGKSVPIATRTTDVALPFETTATGTVTKRADPARHAALLVALRPKSVELMHLGDSVAALFRLPTGQPPLPVGIGMKVFIRINGHEYPAGDIGAPAGNISHTVAATAFRVDAGTATQCDLILRADPRGAERTTDTFDIWDGELVFNDVPLVWLPSPTTAATTRPARPAAKATPAPDQRPVPSTAR